MKENCENCTFFNGTAHEKDSRTRHAGFCSKWVEITFKRDTCKQYFSSVNKTEKEVFPPLVDLSKLPSIDQLTLF